MSVATGLGELLLFSFATVYLVGAGLLLARWIVGATGATFNFCLNRGWAFEARDQSRRRQIKRFACVLAGAVTLGTVVWWLGVATTPVAPHVMQPISMGLTWLVFTYPMMRRWVFEGA